MGKRSYIDDYEAVVKKELTRDERLLNGAQFVPREIGMKKVLYRPFELRGVMESMGVEMSGALFFKYWRYCSRPNCTQFWCKNDHSVKSELELARLCKIYQRGEHCRCGEHWHIGNLDAVFSLYMALVMGKIRGSYGKYDECIGTIEDGPLDGARVLGDPCDLLRDWGPAKAALVLSVMALGGRFHRWAIVFIRSYQGEPGCLAIGARLCSLVEEYLCWEERGGLVVQGGRVLRHCLGMSLNGMIFLIELVNASSLVVNENIYETLLVERWGGWVVRIVNQVFKWQQGLAGLSDEMFGNIYHDWASICCCVFFVKGHEWIEGFELELEVLRKLQVIKVAQTARRRFVENDENHENIWKRVRLLVEGRSIAGQ